MESNSKEPIDPETSESSVNNPQSIEISDENHVIIDKLNSIDQRLVELLNSVSDFTYKDEINNRLHDELQKATFQLFSCSFFIFIGP